VTLPTPEGGGFPHEAGYLPGVPWNYSAIAEIRCPTSGDKRNVKDFTQRTLPRCNAQSFVLKVLGLRAPLRHCRMMYWGLHYIYIQYTKLRRQGAIHPHA